MNAPGWFLAGSAAFLVGIMVLRFGNLSRLWRRMRDHPEQMGDEWDPFE
jgi:hypothetical protein